MIMMIIELAYDSDFLVLRFSVMTPLLPKCGEAGIGPVFRARPTTR
jgi:hypothetical protein